MPTVVITPEHLFTNPSPFVEILERNGFEVRYPENRTLARGETPEAEVIANVQMADAVIAGGEAYSASILAALPGLRVIARAGVGYDRVDVAAATERGIAVTITPNANHECVAEHTLAMMFAAAKNIIASDRSTREGKWDRTLTEPVRGKTFGILGLGRIGRSVAVRVKALGMRVIACEQQPNASFVRAQEIELVGLDELLARSDFLSLHCPACPETNGIINRHTLAKMKPMATLINTARGKLVVEADLVEALRAGTIRSACIDVFEQEPPRADNPLFALSNVILAPHLGGMDKLSLENMGIESAENIVNLYLGRWPVGAVVNGTLESNWKWQR
jgi:D-3-phosphoglycerate dehydrogenase/(S)-sulfolactate dehydrogenase